METIEKSRKNRRSGEHGSYLQGMETRFRRQVKCFPKQRTDPTYKEWKPAIRPENSDMGCAARILPTRNGNRHFIHSSCSVSWASGTDPTYKEWKPGMVEITRPAALKRTDPTYKEWKRKALDEGLTLNLGTDPTYKEWKRMQLAEELSTEFPHGSYLQGMETRDILIFSASEDQGTDPTYKEWKP